VVRTIRSHVWNIFWIRWSWRWWSLVFLLFDPISPPNLNLNLNLNLDLNLLNKLVALYFQFVLLFLRCSAQTLRFYQLTFLSLSLSLSIYIYIYIYNECYRSGN
jgi:hypothetical protein